MTHTSDWDGTLLDQPRVTVIVVCTPEDEGPDGALMHCVHAIEQQTYPREQVDTHIVRNVDGSDLTAMTRFGVQHAETEWVAIINVHDTWPETLLAYLMAEAARTPGLKGYMAHGGYIVKKDTYLERTAS
jgi:hypothetical protein